MRMLEFQKNIYLQQKLRLKEQGELAGISSTNML